MSQFEQVRLRFDPVAEDGTPPATELSAAARIGNTRSGASSEPVGSREGSGWDCMREVRAGSR